MRVRVLKPFGISHRTYHPGEDFETDDPVLIALARDPNTSMGACLMDVDRSNAFVASLDESDETSDGSGEGGYD